MIQASQMTQAVPVCWNHGEITGNAVVFSISFWGARGEFTCCLCASLLWNIWGSGKNHQRSLLITIASGVPVVIYMGAMPEMPGGWWWFRVVPAHWWVIFGRDPFLKLTAKQQKWEGEVRRCFAHEVRACSVKDITQLWHGPTQRCDDWRSWSSCRGFEECSHGAVAWRLCGEKWCFKL